MSTELEVMNVSTLSRPRRVPSTRPGPLGGKRDQNRRKRTESLVKAGLTLFLERGLEPVTVDDIAGAAGMAKGNFYRYFRDKSDLVDAILEPIARDARSALKQCENGLSEAGNRDALFAAYEQLARALTEICVVHVDAVRLYLQERRSPAVGVRSPIRELADEIAERSLRLTQVAIDHGLLKVAEPRVSALAVVGAVEELMLAVLRGVIDAPSSHIASSLISLVLEGLRAK